MITGKDLQARRKFLTILEWFLSVVNRYSKLLQFSLVHLEYEDKKKLGGLYGAVIAREQLSSMTMALQSAFRKADLVARNGTDFWILVPYTSSTENIYDKIVNIMREAQHMGLNVVDRNISIFSLPLNVNGMQDNHFPDSALELLKFLKMHTHEYATHSFKLSHSNLNLTEA